MNQLTIGQLFYRFFVSIMILIVFLSVIMYFSVRNIGLFDFIVFVGIEFLIILMTIWLNNKIKKNNQHNRG